MSRPPTPLPASAIYRVITWNVALFHQLWWATGLPRLHRPLLSLSLILDMSLLLQNSSTVKPLGNLTHITILRLSISTHTNTHALPCSEHPLFIEWGSHRNRVEASMPEIRALHFLLRFERKLVALSLLFTKQACTNNM